MNFFDIFSTKNKMHLDEDEGYNFFSDLESDRLDLSIRFSERLKQN
jgi:hypothetical protein